MPSPVRLVAAAALALAALGAAAQTVVSPVVIVQQLAPQIVNFTGSQLNFQSLVNGLALGAPVQLVTVLPNGFTQVVTFTPVAALAPADIARVLETARQQLIGLGIAAPTAEQIGFTLMGGIVPTALGGSPVSGVTSSVIVQFIPNATTGPTTTPAGTGALRNTSDSPLPAGATSFGPSAGNTSNTPTSNAPPPAAGTDGALRAAPPGTPPAGRPKLN